MLIKRPDIVKSSEITSEQQYLARRKFMQLIGGAAVALGASTVIEACSSDPGVPDFAGSGGPAVPAGQSPLSNYKPRAVATDEALNSFEEITSYNNFYEFGTGKNDPQRILGQAEDQPVEGKDRRALQQASGLSAGRLDQAAPARGTDLPVAMR